MNIPELRQRHPDHWMKAAALRVLAMDAVQKANSGHPGMPMGMAGVATVLFEKHLKFDPTAPRWPDRDRFVLSAGHGSMLLYGLLYLTGYADMTIEDIKRFRQLGSPAAGHPEFGDAAGIETTTGPLGQGLGNAVGMAIAEASLAARFGRKVVDHHTWVIAGDGCLMEGISHEAIGLAGRQKLDRLIVMWDDNGISIDGKVSLSDITDQKARFAASGWSVHECDGHDPDDVDRALTEAKASDRPAMIDCRTHIGFGAPTKQDTKAAHGSPLGADEIAAGPRDLRLAVSGLRDPERGAGRLARDRGARRAGAARPGRSGSGKLSGAKRAEFERVIGGEMPKRLGERARELPKAQSEAAPKVATRKSSEMVLEVVNAVVPETLGGSADLTGSNNTLTKGLGVFSAEDRAGRYIHYGIREHGMAAAMNGIALHGGRVPYGGTFLVFSDYARGAMRLSAIMRRAGDLRADPQLDRARRGRADAPAGRAPGDAPGDAEPQRVPAGGHGRDRRGVGAGADERGDALGAGADAAEPVDGADQAQPAEPDRPRRLRAGRGGGAAAGDPDRHRLGGRDRARGARASCRARGSGRGWCRCRAGSCSRPRTRSIAGACCRRVRCGSRWRRPSRVRLGPLALRRARGGEEGGLRRDARASAPRRRSRRSIRTSGSPPKRSRRRRNR